MMRNRTQFGQRVLALLLAAVLLFAAVPAGTFRTDAESVESDALSFSGFDADLTGWVVSADVGTDGSLTWEDGTASLKTEESYGMETEKLIAVNPTGTYSLSYTASLSEGGELSAYIYYYTLEGYTSDMPFVRLDGMLTTAADRKTCSNDFTVPAGTYQVAVRFVLRSQTGGEVTARLDDVAVTCKADSGNTLNAGNMPGSLTAYDAGEQALLKAMRESVPNTEFSVNVDFNEDETLPWNLWSGSSVADGLLTQSADSNGYAEGTQKYTVEQGKEYEITARLRANGRSQAVIWIWELRENGSVIREIPYVRFYASGSNGWVDVRETYTPSAGTAAVKLHLQANEGAGRGGTIQWDWIKIEKQSQEPETTEPETTEPETTAPETTVPETTAPTALDFALDVNFGDGEVLPWNLWSGSAVADGILTQSADSNGYAEGTQKYTVEQGETYQISAKIRANGLSQAIIWIWELRENGSVIREIPYVRFYASGSNGWVDVRETYTPSAGTAAVKLHLQANEGAGRGGTIQWDWIKIEKQSQEPETTEPETTAPETTAPETTVPETTVPETTVPTALDFAMDVNFGDGEVLPWKLWSGSSVADGMLTQSADSNGYAEGNQPYVIQQGKTYQISAKIQANGLSQAIIWIWELRENGSVIQEIPYVSFFASGSNGWTDFNVEYTPSAGTAAVVMHLQTNEGAGQGGSVSWDYVKVAEKQEASEPCVPPNGDFEQGNVSWEIVTAGSGSYQVEKTDGNNVLRYTLGTTDGQIYGWSQQVPVKPNYIYTVSYRLKVTPDSTENLLPYGAISIIQEFSSGGVTGFEQSGSIRNQTDGWETVTYEFVTSANAQAIRLDLMYVNNPGTALFDDVSITEKCEYVPVVLDAKYDHGGTEETASAENVIENGTFDGGLIQGWSPKEGIGAYPTKNENGGVLLFRAKPGSYLQSNSFAIQGLSEYQLTYYVKVEDAQNLEFFSYFFHDAGENWSDFLTTRVTENTNGQWKKVQVTFATPALPEGTHGYLGFKSAHTQDCQWQKTNQDADCTCHGSAVIYLDDISLIRLGAVEDVGDGLASEDSILFNGSFERYYSDPKSVDGWDMNIFNRNHDARIQKEIAHSGSAIAIQAVGHSYIWAQDFSVEPGSIYILSYWVRVDKAVGLKFAPYMNDANYEGGWWLDDAAQPLYDVTDGWVKVTGVVSIPESVGKNEKNPDCKVQLGFQVYEGGGILYLDDVSFIKTDVDASNPNLNFDLSGEALYNWSFASYGGKGSVTPSNAVRPGSGGSVSAKVYNGIEGGNTVLVSSKLPVQPNTTYEFSYWVRTTGNNNSAVTPFFRQIWSDGVSRATSLSWDGSNSVTTWSDIISPFWTYQIMGEVGWQQSSLSVTTGPDTYFLEIRLNVSGANTTAYFDDISLRQTVKDVNLDFELTSQATGAPANWFTSNGRAYKHLFESDTSVYHSGSQSLHLVKDSLLEKTVIDSCAYIPVDPEKTYEFSFWMCSKECDPTATIRMNLQLYRADGTRIYLSDGNYRAVQGTVASLNSSSQRSGWTKVVTRATPVTEAAYATISFIVTRGDAEVWIDDIFFQVVEDGTDCVVYYDDFHALDESGNTGDWTLETVSGEASFAAGKGGTLTVESGESYIHNQMKQIATDYTYLIRGNYRSDMGGTAEIRFYDYKHNEIEDSRVTTLLRADGEEFVLNFTAPSNTFASLYIGSDQAGTMELKDVTVYMIAKSSKSADWDGIWVWYPENPVKEAVEQYRYFRYTFTMNEEAEYAPLQLTVDDKYAFYLNGELIDDNWDAGTDSWANVASYDLTEKVRKGENVIALKCYNLVSEAGILFDGKFTLSDGSTFVVASSSDVVSTKTVDEESMAWVTLDYDDSGWMKCQKYGQPPCSPWGPVFYDTTLYIDNKAEVVGTAVPESVTAGRDLEFTVTLLLESPIEANFTPTVTIYRRNSITAITSVPLTFVTNDKPLDWPVGEPFEVQCRISIPDYFETGKYTLKMDENMLLLSGDEVYENKFLDFKVVATSSARDNVVSSVEVYNGTPTLIIDGEPVASHFYLRPDLNVYLQTDAESRIYKSDLELFITYGGSLYKGGCDPIWLEDGTIDFDAFDSVIYETLAASNDALVMVNIGMFAPTWWLEQNPDHRVLAHNGSQYLPLSDVSFASEKFREEAGEVLRQLIRHMKEQSYYNRVFGLKISGGQTYEWFCWGTGPNQGPDYSPVSQESFRKYLEEKYKTVEALQEAWGDKTVTFENAAAPGWLERGSSPNVYMGDADTGSLSRNMVDWNLYLNEASADSFLYYCQIAKEETDNQIIVGGYNGYLWTSNSYDSQGMAHTAMNRVLNSPYVDWIASPVAYNERLLGESNTYMAMLDSVQEHGKLYIAEQDNRTCLSSVYAGAPWDAEWDFSVGQTRTVADTIYQQKRDFANALVNGAGLWQYDMYGGWLDDDQIYQYLADAKAEYDFSVYLDRNQRNEVAIFVGDETYAYLTVENNNMSYSLLEPMLMEQRKHLSAMGTGYDTYAMSSLLDGKVTPHKLNIVFSPFEITEEMSRAIDQQLKCNGQIVVWVYLPGISDGTTMDAGFMKPITGFDIGVVEQKATLQVKLAKTDHVLTQGIEGMIYGSSGLPVISPLTYIKNTSEVKVLGFNMDGGAAGLGVRDMGDWTSVYSASPCLDVELLRNLLKLAGCHVYSENNEDVIYSNNHYVALHSATAEEKTITLPGNYAVYDVFEEKFISMDTDTITYWHEADDTHIFRLMTPNTYAVTARIKGGKGTLSDPGLKELSPGESYTLTVTPNDGYEVASVIVNDAPAELENNVLTLDSVNENTVIEVKFSKLPEMVQITEYVEELIILPWPAAIGILAVLGVGIWGMTRGVKALRRKIEEGGY